MNLLLYGHFKPCWACRCTCLINCFILQKLRGPAKRKAEPEISEEQKQRLAEQREKRAAARNRLKEMKAAAKRGNPACEKDKPIATDDSVFEEFVSSVAIMELTTPKKKKCKILRFFHLIILFISL